MGDITNIKILIVGAKWPPETFLERLIRGLVDRGIDITFATGKRSNTSSSSHPGIHWLFAPNWHGPFPWRFLMLAYLFLRGLVLDRPTVRRISGLGKPIPPFGERLRAWFKYLPFAGYRWDIVYFPWNSAAIEYAQFFRGICPFVVSCRGSQVNIAPFDPNRPGIVEGLRQTFQTAAAVHCVSEAIKSEAMKYGLAPEKARVIRPAVDPDFFQPVARSHSNNDFTIISVGNLVWPKGYEYALQAIRMLVDQKIFVSYHIIGDGPERQRVLYTIDDLSLHDQVHLHGSLSPAEVRSQLQQADVFLLASLSEGISNAALEAMACGLPVVTTDCGGMPEAVTDGVEGFVVQVRDSSAMAMALARLASNTSLRQSLGGAARQRVCQHFTLDHQIRGFVSLFQSLGKRSEPKHALLANESPLQWPRSSLRSAHLEDR